MRVCRIIRGGGDRNNYADVRGWAKLFCLYGNAQ